MVQSTVLDVLANTRLKSLCLGLRVIHHRARLNSKPSCSHRRHSAKAIAPVHRVVLRRVCHQALLLLLRRRFLLRHHLNHLYQPKYISRLIHHPPLTTKDNLPAMNVTWSRRTSSLLIVTLWRDTVDHRMGNPNKDGSDVLVDIRRASTARVIILGISRSASLINGCCESSSVSVLSSILTRISTPRTMMPAASAGGALDAHVWLDQLGFSHSALANNGVVMALYISMYRRYTAFLSSVVFSLLVLLSLSYFSQPLYIAHFSPAFRYDAPYVARYLHRLWLKCTPSRDRLTHSLRNHVSYVIFLFFLGAVLYFKWRNVDSCLAGDVVVVCPVRQAICELPVAMAELG